MTGDSESYSFPLFMVGSASTWEPEPESEAETRVRDLRQAVQEITGQNLSPPPRQRIGFLP